jgi:hypothetical protein
MQMVRGNLPSSFVFSLGEVMKHPLGLDLPTENQDTPLPRGDPQSCVSHLQKRCMDELSCYLRIVSIRAGFSGRLG